ncbi:hypothetical protein F0562_007427 [Nyssa sinensis]|uniref:Uncharacterized protein n=1 Tax=Nyssa sinensis TaxID=561372 RepID=A0A5J5A6U2_9ASTE|nr:hypothetical protein F0562_007427 [Nyssa sinensis]
MVSEQPHDSASPTESMASSSASYSSSSSSLSSSSLTPPSITPSFSHIVTTKLTTDNYLLWKVQTFAYLRGQDLYGYVDGTQPKPPKFLSESPDSPPTINPAYSLWKRTDQLVLSVLFSSLSNSILGHVLSCSTAQALWHSVVSMFSYQSQAKKFQIRFQLTNITRGDQSITDYFGKVGLLVDSLATIGNLISEKELNSYILNGLGPTYESFLTSITTRSDPLTSHDLYQLLLIHESRLNHTTTLTTPSDFFANFTSSSQTRSRSPFRSGRQGRGRGRSPHTRGGRSYSPNNGSQQSTMHRPTCQICNKSGHVALQCRNRFNYSYQYDSTSNFSAPSSASNQFSANYTALSLHSKNLWYSESAATHHITNDLSNLNLSSEQYTGRDTIRVSDGFTDQENPPHQANQ